MPIILHETAYHFLTINVQPIIKAVISKLIHNDYHYSSLSSLRSPAEGMNGIDSLIILPTNFNNIYDH